MSITDAVARMGQIQAELANLQTAFALPTTSSTSSSTDAASSSAASASTFSAELASAMSPVAAAIGDDATTSGVEGSSDLTDYDPTTTPITSYTGYDPTATGVAGTTGDDPSATQVAGYEPTTTGTTGATLPSSASTMLTSDQQAFASRLAGDTGLDSGVVTAWLLAEESGGAATSRQSQNNNDWLNIGYTGAGTYGAADSVWSNPVTAADATAGWLKGQSTIPGYGTASSGIQSILNTAGQPPATQISAIQTSGWAGSGYPDLPSLYQQVA